MVSTSLTELQAGCSICSSTGTQLFPRTHEEGAFRGPRPAGIRTFLTLGHGLHTEPESPGPERLNPEQGQNRAALAQTSTLLQSEENELASIQATHLLHHQLPPVAYNAREMVSWAREGSLSRLHVHVPMPKTFCSEAHAPDDLLPHTAKA